MIDTIRPIDTFSYELMIKTLDYTEYLLILPVENMSNTGKKRDWGVKMPVLSRFSGCSVLVRSTEIRWMPSPP